MTPAEIERNAIGDADNPPLDADELDAIRIARFVQAVRQSRGLIPRTPHVAPGLDPASVPLEVLDVYKLAIAPVSFDPARSAATLAEAGAWTKIAATGEVIADAALQGSNNWVVDGAIRRRGGRSSPTTRTAPMRCRPCATSST